MFDWIKSLFQNKEKFVTLGSQSYFYADNTGNVAVTMTATFYIGDRDTRKVELDYEKKLGLSYSPTNHPWYHEICVPFIRKTGLFVTRENAIEAISSITAQPNIAPKEKPKLSNKTDNVLFIDFKKD